MTKLFCDWCKAETELVAILAFAPMMVAGHVQRYEVCYECECLISRFIREQQEKHTKPAVLSA